MDRRLNNHKTNNITETSVGFLTSQQTDFNTYLFLSKTPHHLTIISCPLRGKTNGQIFKILSTQWTTFEKQKTPQASYFHRALEQRRRLRVVFFFLNTDQHRSSLNWHRASKTCSPLLRKHKIYLQLTEGNYPSRSRGRPRRAFTAPQQQALLHSMKIPTASVTNDEAENLCGWLRAA